MKASKILFLKVPVEQVQDYDLYRNLFDLFFDEI